MENKLDLENELVPYADLDFGEGGLLTYSIKKHCISVHCNDGLKTVIKRGELMASCNKLRGYYKTIIGKDINFSSESLAVEILLHYGIQGVTNFALAYPGLAKPTKTFLEKWSGKANVADCGEAYFDNGAVYDAERQYWDNIAKVIPLGTLIDKWNSLV